MRFELLDREPKKLVYKPIKFDEDEVAAINELRMLHKPPKSFSQVVREMCQLRMAQTYGYRLGFHNVRTLSKKFEQLLGNTFTCDVTPKK